MNCSSGTSEGNSTNHSPPSVSAEKRVKALICPSHRTLGKSSQTLQEIINKWQVSNFTKCIYDNAVNAVLESASNDNDSNYHENTSSASLPHDFTLVNEAVLMAIEKKGLRQQDSDYSTTNISDTKNAPFSSKIDFYSSTNDHEDSNDSSAEIPEYLLNNDENLESNFENNFMTTAVSVAIEEKGLNMYHV